MVEETAEQLDRELAQASGEEKAKVLEKFGVSDQIFKDTGELNSYELLVKNKIHAIATTVGQMCPSLGATAQKLVSEVLAVISMSYLFAKRIVGEFSEIIRNMCKILEVNMNNINRIQTVVSAEDVEVKALIGNFRSVEKLQAENQREREEAARATEKQRCIDLVRVMEIVAAKGLQVKNLNDLKHLFRILNYISL
jgi:hypothetical protein